MASVRLLRRAAQACSANSVLIEKLITVSDSRMLAVLREPDIADALANNILQLPKLLTFHLLQAWSNQLHKMSDGAARSIIRAAQSLATYADGAVAVLAERLVHSDSTKPIPPGSAAPRPAVRGSFPVGRAPAGCSGGSFPVGRAPAGCSGGDFPVRRA